MIISKLLSRAFMVLVSMNCLTIPGTTAAAMPEDVPPILQGLSDRLDTLEGFIRRLHGNKAAVVPRNFEFGTAEQINSFNVSLTFCLGDAGGGGGPGGGGFVCRINSADYVLTSEVILNKDSDGVIITFNEENSPDFPGVLDLLTNGSNDRIGIVLSYDNGSSSITSTEKTVFFVQTQTTSEIGYDDLQGIDLGSISVSFDIVNLNYNENDGLTHVDIQSRVFFGLAD